MSQDKVVPNIGKEYYGELRCEIGTIKITDVRTAELAQHYLTLLQAFIRSREQSKV